MHGFESLFLALLSAKIPAERLVGALLCSGIKLDRGGLHRFEGSGFSLGGTRRLIRSRLKLTQELFAELLMEYEAVNIAARKACAPGAYIFRAQDGTPVGYRDQLNFTEVPGPECDPRVVYLQRLEGALVEAVKAGDRAIFDAAVDERAAAR